MSQLLNQIFEIETLTLNAHFSNQFSPSVDHLDSNLNASEQLFDDIKRVLVKSIVTIGIRPEEGFELQPTHLVICERGLSGQEKKQLWLKLSDFQ